MLSNVNFEKISDSGRLHNTVVLLATSLCAPYGVGDPEDAGQQAGELDEDILVNVQGQQELQGLDLCTPPPAHLHHETYYSGEKFNQKQIKIRNFFWLIGFVWNPVWCRNNFPVVGESLCCDVTGCFFEKRRRAGHKRFDNIVK